MGWLTKTKYYTVEYFDKQSVKVGTTYPDYRGKFLIYLILNDKPLEDFLSYKDIDPTTRELTAFSGTVHNNKSLPYCSDADRESPYSKCRPSFFLDSAGKLLVSSARLREYLGVDPLTISALSIEPLSFPALIAQQNTYPNGESKAVNLAAQAKELKSDVENLLNGGNNSFENLLKQQLGLSDLPENPIVVIGNTTDINIHIQYSISYSYTLDHPGLYSNPIYYPGTGAYYDPDSGNIYALIRDRGSPTVDVDKSTIYFTKKRVFKTSRITSPIPRRDVCHDYFLPGGGFATTCGYDGTKSFIHTTEVEQIIQTVDPLNTVTINFDGGHSVNLGLMGIHLLTLSNTEGTDPIDFKLNSSNLAKFTYRANGGDRDFYYILNSFSISYGNPKKFLEGIEEERIDEDFNIGSNFEIIPSIPIRHNYTNIDNNFSVVRDSVGKLDANEVLSNIQSSIVPSNGINYDNLVHTVEIQYRARLDTKEEAVLKYILAFYTSSNRVYTTKKGDPGYDRDLGTIDSSQNSPGIYDLYVLNQAEAVPLRTRFAIEDTSTISEYSVGNIRKLKPHKDIPSPSSAEEIAYKAINGASLYYSLEEINVGRNSLARPLITRSISDAPRYYTNNESSYSSAEEFLANVDEADRTNWHIDYGDRYARVFFRYCRQLSELEVLKLAGYRGYEGSVFSSEYLPAPNYLTKGLYRISIEGLREGNPEYEGYKLDILSYFLTTAEHLEGFKQKYIFDLANVRNVHDRIIAFWVNGNTVDTDGNIIIIKKGEGNEEDITYKFKSQTYYTYDPATDKYPELVEAPNGASLPVVSRDGDVTIFDLTDKDKPLIYAMTGITTTDYIKQNTNYEKSSIRYWSKADIPIFKNIVPKPVENECYFHALNVGVYLYTYQRRSYEVPSFLARAFNFVLQVASIFLALTGISPQATLALTLKRLAINYITKEALFRIIDEIAPDGYLNTLLKLAVSFKVSGKVELEFKDYLNIVDNISKTYARIELKELQTEAESLETEAEEYNKKSEREFEDLAELNDILFKNSKGEEYNPLNEGYEVQFAFTNIKPYTYVKLASQPYLALKPDVSKNLPYLRDDIISI